MAGFAGFAPIAAARENMVRVDLVAATAAAEPGKPLALVARQRLAPGWHTYWTNPGEAGEAMTIDWQLPPGAAAGPPGWPAPHLIRVGSIASYGYEGEALVRVDIALPADLAGDTVTIAGEARWLTCKDICIPERQPVALTLPVTRGAPAAPSPHAAIVAAASAALPARYGGTARFAADAERIRLRLTGQGDTGAAPLHFFPAAWGHIADAAPQQAARDAEGVTLVLQRGDLKAEPPPPTLDGVLVVGEGAARRGFIVTALPGDVAALPGSGVSGATPAGAGSAAGTPLTLWLALLLAFAGGVVLNLMPCVLPVLSLKAFAFAGGGAHRAAGLAYLAGVMATFLALATVLVALRAGGATLGWGFQFQSPAFVLAMAALFFAMGLWLSGVFHLGGGVAGLGDGLARRGGLAGSFFTGLLAAIAATPCTAPFMGAAVGYALAAPPAATFGVIAMLGLGFGLPIALLAFVPALGRLLPRPGAWMETFKQALAFPLYATAAWLVWVLAVQTGSDGVLVAAVALLAVALAAWLAGRGFGTVPAALAALVAVSVVIGGARQLATTAPIAGTPSATAGAVDWQPFSPAALAAAQAAGRPVFLNLTAAWCITCKLNERVALSSARVADAFAAAGIAALKGDWTSYDPAITALLSSFGRAGVPLYVLYPPGAAAPIVLPQLLLESTVIDHVAGLPARNRTAGDRT